MLAVSLNPIDWVTGAAGAVVDGATAAVFDQATAWVEDGLSYLAQQVASALTAAGTTHVGDATMDQLGGVFKWIALVTVVITMMLGAAGSIVGSRHALSGVVREVPITMLMLAAWYGVVSLWLEATRALTTWLMSDSLMLALDNGLVLDAQIASFFRMLIALLMIVFLLIFLLELLVLSHLLAVAAIVGPLAIALRPWEGLRDVSSRMVRNLAMLSLTPPLTVASMSIALGTIDDSGTLDLLAALGGLAGMVVAVLMPALVGRFLPLGGSGSTGARGLVAAGAAATGMAAGAVMTGGASAAAAAPGALNASSFGGAGGGQAAGGLSVGAQMGAATLDRGDDGQ